MSEDCFKLCANMHNLKIPMHELRQEETMSKQFTRIPKLYPQYDVVRNNDPPSKLAHLQVILCKTENNLKKARSRLTSKRQELDKQWVEISGMENALRDNFESFNDFILENREKRNRSLKAVFDGQRQLIERYEDIAILTKKMEQVNLVKADMMELVKKCEIFESFLLDTIKEFEFSSIDQLISNYNSLQIARKDLAKKEDEYLKRIENANAEFVKLTNDKTIKISELRNQLVSLQTRYKVARTKTLEYEQLVFRIGEKGIECLESTAIVKLATWNLCKKIAKKKNVRLTVKRQDLEKQMCFIKEELLEMRQVQEILERNARFGGKRQGPATSKKQVVCINI